MAVEPVDGFRADEVIEIQVQVAASLFLSPRIQARVDVQGLVVDHAVAFRAVDRVDDPVDRIAYPPVVQRDRNQEVIPPIKQLVDVLLAVEAFIENVKKAFDF